MFNFKSCMRVGLCIFLFGCTGNLSKNTPENTAKKKQIIVASLYNDGTIFPEKNSSYWIDVTNSTNDTSTKIQSYLARKDFENARRLVLVQLEKEPGSPDLLLYLATAYAIEKNFGRARYYAELAAEKNPQMNEAQNIIALEMLAQARSRSDFDSVQKTLEDALGSGSNQIAVALNLGSLAMMRNDVEKAREAFRIATERCQSCGAARILEAQLALYQNKYEDAKSILSAFDPTEPQYGEALYLRAIVSKTGFLDFAAARQDLQLIVSGDTFGPPLKKKANALLRSITAMRPTN